MLLHHRLRPPEDAMSAELIQAAMFFDAVSPREPWVGVCDVAFAAASHAEAKTPPAGLEPAIFGLEVRRLVH